MPLCHTRLHTYILEPYIGMEGRVGRKALISARGRLPHCHPPPTWPVYHAGHLPPPFTMVGSPLQCTTICMLLKNKADFEWWLAYSLLAAINPKTVLGPMLDSSPALCDTPSLVEEVCFKMLPLGVDWAILWPNL